MIPLLVLLGSFLFLLAVRSVYKDLTLAWAGRLAFAVMLLFAGTSHFYLTKGMVMSLPAFVPARETLVYLTGVIEIVLAFALVLAKNKRPVARWIIAFLVMALPSNIYAALNHVDMKNATYTGAGPLYLFFRVPLQLFFIAWVYYFSMHQRRVRFVQANSMQWTVVDGRAGRMEVIEEDERRLHYWD